MRLLTNHYDLAHIPAPPERKGPVIFIITNDKGRNQGRVEITYQQWIALERPAGIVGTFDVA
jgi:hypothetical protein